jgi:tRNA-dihydrouridine synthase
MAGMTDTAFRRLVKRHGGCGLVVTEMVSVRVVRASIARSMRSTGRGRRSRCRFSAAIRTRWRAAQIVEGMGADTSTPGGCPCQDRETPAAA